MNRTIGEQAFLEGAMNTEQITTNAERGEANSSRSELATIVQKVIRIVVVTAVVVLVGVIVVVVIVVVMS